MAKAKKRTDIHGWVVFDKPVGMTSTQAVGKIKWLFNVKKAGHAGTLDPLASGCLPIALGEATKTVSYVVGGRKLYEFAVRWGSQTTTEDAEGEVVVSSDNRPDRDSILAVLEQFTGEISQTPPAFSAIKVDGKRAYDLARAGIDVKLNARPVTIYSLELVEIVDSDTARFRAQTSKGTYIRSLGRDLALSLDTCGHIVELRRLNTGPFQENHMISLEKLETLRNSAPGEENLANALRPIETALDDIPALAVDRNGAARLRRGQSVLLRGRDAPIHHGLVYATCAGELVALAEVDQAELHPRRVFNLSPASVSDA